MKKYFLLSLLAILTLTASAQTNTYAMVIEMQNGTKLTIGPNEVKNVTFNNGELTVSGETIETLVASAINQAKEYTDQAAANLKGYIDLSRELAELKADIGAITAELAAKQTLIENNDAAIMTMLNTKVSELSKLINDNADAIKANAKAIADNKAAQDAANVIMNNAIAQNAKDIAEKAAAQNEKNSSFEKAIEAIKKALGDDTAETLKAYAKSIAESSALQTKLDAQDYVDAKDNALSRTLIAAISDQAEQDQKAWSAAINTCVDNLVKTYQLNALSEIISARINEAIVNLIQTYNLQKP